MGLGDDGGGGPRGRRPGPHARGRADLVPVVIDDETYRQAYDVVANTTLWYCHHHLFDLPHRPRFDRHWRAAWEGYRTYNRAMADVIVAQAGQGDSVFVQDYHFSLLGRMLAEAPPGPADGALLAHALRRARPARRAARRRGGRAPRRHGRLRGLRLPLPPVGGRLRRLLRRRGPAGATDVRGPARPRCRRRSRKRPRRRPAPRRRPRCAPRWAGAASSPGPTAWSRPRTLCGGCSPSRSCCTPTPSGAAGWCTWPRPIPAGRGWPSISPTPPTWSTRRRASTMRWGTRPPVGHRSCSRSRTTGSARSPC